MLFPGLPRHRMTGALAAIVLAASSVAGCASAVTTTAPAATASTTAATAPTSTPPTAAASPNAARLRAEAASSVQKIIASRPEGGVSVAAANTTTGASFSAGATSGMWTASAYKLFVLEALLLQTQDSGGLSDSEEDAAAPAIENSDNTSGYQLFDDAGGNSALAAAFTTFGMSHTVPGDSDPTFTTTSGSDALHLLQNLVSSSSPLNAASRSFTLGLMRTVEADQRWGVGVVADEGTTFANKNGWLSIDDTNGPGETDNGLWAVNSLGIVTVHGQQVLMAVFTRHDSDYDSGVDLVEQLAKAMTPAVVSGAA